MLWQSLWSWRPLQSSSSSWRPLTRLCLVLIGIPWWLTFLHVHSQASEGRWLLVQRVGSGSGTYKVSSTTNTTRTTNAATRNAISSGLYYYRSGGGGSGGNTDLVLLSRINNNDDSSSSLGFPEPRSFSDYGPRQLLQLLLRDVQSSSHPDDIETTASIVMATTKSSDQQQIIKISSQSQSADDALFCLSVVSSSSVTTPNNNNSNNNNEVLLACRRRSPPSSSSTNSIIGSYYDNDSNNNSTVAYRISEASLLPTGSSSSSNVQESYNGTKERPWLQQMVLHQPTTLLWILLNVSLAFYYWNNNNVQVANVALQYSRIIITAGSDGTTGGTTTGEPWRCLSGSTAHFEPWHLFFNMQALYSLGLELEHEMYSSLDFMLYNGALLIVTPALWLALETVRMRIISIVNTRRGDNNNNSATTAIRDVPTVGFSGVLFAWMFLAAVQQPQTCPVFFLPNLCFQTHTIHIFGRTRLPWNVGPLVQLVVAQVVLPRVSATGHLAGLLAGLFIHVMTTTGDGNASSSVGSIKGFPLIRYLQPAICLPLAYAIYLKYIQRTANSGNGGSQLFVLPQCWWLRGMIPMTLCSIVLFGWDHPQTLGFAATMLFWMWESSSRSRCASSNSHHHHQLLVLTRGAIVVTVVYVVTLSMALAKWTLMRTSHVAFVLGFLQLVWLVCMLCRGCHSEREARTEPLLQFTDGIFQAVLEVAVLEPAQAVGRELVMNSQSRTTTNSNRYLSSAGGNFRSNTHHPQGNISSSASSNFQGVGQRLGGGSTTSRKRQESSADQVV